MKSHSFILCKSHVKKQRTHVVGVRDPSHFTDTRRPPRPGKETGQVWLLAQSSRLWRRSAGARTARHPRTLPQAPTGTRGQAGLPLKHSRTPTTWLRSKYNHCAGNSEVSDGQSVLCCREIGRSDLLGLGSAKPCSCLQNSWSLSAPLCFYCCNLGRTPVLVSQHSPATTPSFFSLP